MMMHDVVATIEDLPEIHLTKGQVGPVVDELDREFMLVEFADIDGVAYAIEPISCRKLMTLHHRPILAA